MIRIATWNINSIRYRLHLLQRFITEQGPDIIALQETKTEDALFPEQAINEMGYKVYFTGQKSYNGVAFLTKITIEHIFFLQLYNDDRRHIAIRMSNMELHNFYVPAGGDIPDANENSKFKHKLEYLCLMRKWFNDNRSRNDQMIIVGDLNVAPHEHDVWSSRQLRNVVSHTDIERQMFTQLQQSNHFIDSARYFIPLSEKCYSWWSYRNRNWRKSNRGRRLDHILVSSNLQNSMTSITFMSEARDWPLPSDHIPCLLTLS